jgi:hypothetical protein
MRDDFYSAAWAEHHGRLSGAIHKAIRTLAQSMEWLNRYQFSAPWRQQPPRRPHAGQ